MDTLGNPLRFILTAGQRADSPQAAPLIEGFEPQAVIADKGHDADALLAALAASDSAAVIPPKKNRLEQREYDRHLYRERHLIECCIKSSAASPSLSTTEESSPASRNWQSTTSAF